MRDLTKNTDSYKSPFGLIREMGYTRQEFFNLLPKTLTDYTFSIEGNLVKVELDYTSVLINVGDERERRFTPFVMLPILPVEIQFIGTDEQAKSNFLKHFDASYMKGLG